MIGDVDDERQMIVAIADRIGQALHVRAAEVVLGRADQILVAQLRQFFPRFAAIGTEERIELPSVLT